MSEGIWFNISVMYSAICTALAVESVAGNKRFMLTFLAVHGGLWAIYRGGVLAVRELKGTGRIQG
jgi:hypothetical protein